MTDDHGWAGTVHGMPRPGDTAERSKTVTMRDVALYTEITGDRNPLHYDEAAARQSRFGGLIVQGGVTSGILNAIVAEDLPGPGTVFLAMELKFAKAVHVGDTITGTVEVVSVRTDKPICNVAVTVRDQRGEVCLNGTATTYTVALRTHRLGDREVEAIAAQALDALGQGKQVAPFSGRHDGFDLDAAYRVAAVVRAARMARGERPVGRKIGFTNRTIWAEYGVWAPIWGDVYDRTVRDLPAAGEAYPLAGLAEPRIEPEVVFGLARAPQPGMDEAALLDGVEWVAHGFEIVQSIFPGWKFTAADAVAAFGLHGALLVGPRHPVQPQADRWFAALESLEVELSCDGAAVDRGGAANVLGGPLSALRHLVESLARDVTQPPLAAGDVVTTGTLTRALPVAAGQTWTTVLHGADMAGVAVRFG